MLTEGDVEFSDCAAARLEALTFLVRFHRFPFSKLFSICFIVIIQKQFAVIKQIDLFFLTVL